MKEKRNLTLVSAKFAKKNHQSKFSFLKNLPYTSFYKNSTPIFKPGVFVKFWGLISIE